jgi:PAS domain-containing protein
LSVTEEELPGPPTQRDLSRPRAAGGPDDGSGEDPPLADDEIAFRYRIRPEPRAEYVSPQVARLTGYVPGEFYADPWLVFVMIHPDDLPLLLRLGPDDGATSRPLRFRRKDGGVIVLEQRWVAVRAPDGELDAIEGIARAARPRAR